MDITILIFLGSIFVLILMSGFFSGSETALTAASRAHMHRLENGGNKRAGQVMSLIRDQEHLIATVLLGNNLVNILATALATSLFTTLWGDLGVAYATVAMTALVLIFAEVLPKTYAIGNADRVALIVAPVFRWLVRLLRPLVAAVQWTIGGILRLLQTDDADLHRPQAREELRGAIALGTSEGRLHHHEKSMLGGILDLDDVYVADVMIHRRSMETVNLGLGTEAIVQQVMTSPHTRLPVWQDEPENIVGVLHAKDLLRQVLASTDHDTSRINIAGLLSEPWFVPETNSLREQLNAFRQRRAHFALVVDEYGVVLGLVTLEDILEEIVGDIHDEHDIEQKGYDVLVDGAIVVDGTYPIRDLNRAFDWNLSDMHATTIAGFVIHRAQTIPEVGRTFLFDDFLFQVLERKKHQLTRLKVTPPDLLEADVAELEDDG